MLNPQTKPWAQSVHTWLICSMVRELFNHVDQVVDAGFVLFTHLQLIEEFWSPERVCLDVSTSWKLIRHHYTLKKKRPWSKKQKQSFEKSKLWELFVKLFFLYYWTKKSPTDAREPYKKKRTKPNFPNSSGCNASMGDTPHDGEVIWMPFFFLFLSFISWVSLIRYLKEVHLYSWCKKLHLKM